MTMGYVTEESLCGSWNGKRFFSCPRFQTDSGAHPSSVLWEWVEGGSFTGVKQQRCLDKKCAQLYSTPPPIFLAWYLNKYGNKFIFPLVCSFVMTIKQLSISSVPHSSYHVLCNPKHCHESMTFYLSLIQCSLCCTSL
jgi:hypothetical protein